MLAPALINRTVARKRFTTEAQTMAKLQHPNIVSVVGMFYAERNQPYMVMEYLAGGSVSLRVEKLGPLTPVRAGEVVRQLLPRSKSYNSGIVHRDIKPLAILILGQNVIKVADFGIAHIATSDHSPTQPASPAPSRMSPEQRAQNADPRSDLYAAATLYNVLTGKEPYDLFSTEIQAKVLGGSSPVIQTFIAKWYEATGRGPLSIPHRDAYGPRGGRRGAPARPRDSGSGCRSRICRVLRVRTRRKPPLRPSTLPR